MSKNLTLRTSASASTTTTTKTTGNVVSQPFETNTETAETAVDLDATAIERAVSLTLAWNTPSTGAPGGPSLNVAIEAGPTASGPWTQVAKFDQVLPERVPSGSQTIGFVSPSQFIRAKWTLAPFASGMAKASATFGVTGVAS